jgi:hypothetical protein
MPITIPAKSNKYYKKALKSSDTLVQTVDQVLKPHENEAAFVTIKTKDDVGQIKGLGQQIFGEVLNAQGIKSEMKRLRELHGAVEKISYVNKNPNQKKYSATEINDAHNVFDMSKERADNYVKPQYRASQYAGDPYLMINTYIDYLQSKYGKEKDVFEQARYDQKNASTYHLVDPDPTKDLINKMEMDAMKGINSRLAAEVANIKTIENKRTEFKDVSNSMYTYVNGLKLTDPKNIGKPLTMDKATAMAPKEFWSKVTQIESKINVTPAMLKDPQYLKAEAYSQFFSGNDMNSIIALNLADPSAAELTRQLTEMASNYHIKGLKKKMVKMRKEYKEFLKKAEVQAVKEILEKAVKLGSTKNSWLGASREKAYDDLVKSHSDLFLNKNSAGHSKFQIVAANLISYEAAFTALREMTTLGTKNVAADKLKQDRLHIVDDLKKKSLNGEIYNEFIGKLESAKPTATASNLIDQAVLTTMGYSQISDLLDNTKTLNISSLSKAEQDEYEKSRKKIEDAVATNQQVGAIDTFSVIKYGNKALLMQFDSLLPAKSRTSIKMALVKQFDGIDVSSKDAAEKLEKARASVLTSMLFEGSNTSITNAVKKAFGTAEYKKVKKTLLDAYGNDFSGYTDASWSYVNDSLKKACGSLQGITFV